MVRTAAYSLQLPSERAALHGLALDCLERQLQPDQREAHVIELADHASLAAEFDETFQARELALLKRAECWTAANYRLHDRLRVNAAIAEHPLAGQRDRSSARLARGHCLRLLGRNEEAGAELQLCLQDPDPAIQTSARNQLAGVHLRSGRHAQALETFKAALQDSSDDSTRARLMANIGLVHFELDEPEACAEYVRQAREIAEATGDPHLQATVLNGEARMLHHAARTVEAREAYNQTLALLGDTGDLHLRASTSANLAELLRVSMGPGVEEAFKVALKLANEVGERVLEKDVVGNYGLLLHSMRRLSEAREYMEQSLEIALELGDETSAGYALSNLFGLLTDLGDTGPAEGALSRALEIAERTGDNRLLSAVLMNRGATKGCLADLERALEHATDELQREQALTTIQEFHAARDRQR